MKVAVLTMVRDEGAMLSLWVDHYARQVGLGNLVVLDDGSTDGSTEGLGCTVHRLPGLPGAQFEQARMELVSAMAADLLVTHDRVVFVDADEFLVADPAHHAGLVDLFAARSKVDVLGAVGLNIVHVPALEPTPLDLTKPVLAQRRFVKFAPVMCKPSVKRVAAPWVAASHGIEHRFAIDPELFMLHLKFADRDRLAAVARERNAQSAADGRAAGSSWGRPADDIMRIFDRVTDDAAGDVARGVPEFDANAVDLDAVVQRRGRRVWRTPEVGQIAVLRHQPLVGVPDRLLGQL